MTRHTRLNHFVLFAVGVLLLAPFASSARAQQVRWLSDYNQARKEAAEKGRPLLIDFGTENCFWCKKLDLSTFRDPAVIGILNEQFVSLKIDAEREATLTQALRISQFPTLVLAEPNGKIIGVLEGFQDAATLMPQLKTVGGSFVTPEWMTREYQEAAKAIAASEYSRAVTMLKSVTQDGKERCVQIKARQVLADLEQQAAGRLTRAKQQHDRGQSSQAAETLSDLLYSYAGTQAAADGSTLLTTISRKPAIRDHQRALRARELLAQARDDFRTQQYLGCLDRCESLTIGYADLPEGNEALQLAAEIKDNPERMAKACDSLNRRTSVMYFSLAETWMKKGQAKEAQLCLEKVMQAEPGSLHAERAQVLLTKLQKGTDTQQAEFKKP